jgi:hypothetical protein
MLFIEVRFREGKASGREEDRELWSGLYHEQRLYCIRLEYSYQHWKGMIRVKCLLNNIYKFSSYLTGNTLRLRYESIYKFSSYLTGKTVHLCCKDQSLNGVWGKLLLVVRLNTLCRSVPHEVQSINFRGFCVLSRRHVGTGWWMRVTRYICLHGRVNLVQCAYTAHNLSEPQRTDRVGEMSSQQGGGFEYLHCSPVSRRRQRKDKPVPRGITGPPFPWGI